MKSPFWGGGAEKKNLEHVAVYIVTDVSEEHVAFLCLFFCTLKIETKDSPKALAPNKLLVHGSVRISNLTCMLFSVHVTKFKFILVQSQKLTCYCNTTSWENFKSCFGLSQFVCHTRMKFWLITRKKVSTICLKIR
jgi:hypothetical protein